MKRTSYMSLRAIALCIVSALCVTTVRADIDKKFFDEAARKVWSMELPQFDAGADLSDSIFRDQSAVFIARYVGVLADYNQDPDVAKMRLLGINTANALKAGSVRRNMVKLNDAAAVEKFTDFSIDAPQKMDYKGYTIASTKEAFGARIIKPDGEVRMVDMDEALTVGMGKKNKDAEYKIAIPGLLPGDVLDYFYYEEYYLDEVSMKPFDVNIIRSYPTRSLIVDVSASPYLLVEFGAYNGVPLPDELVKNNGKNQFLLMLENIESLDESVPSFRVARQMPFLRFFFLNPNARLELMPNTSREGGMRQANPFLLMSGISSGMGLIKPEGKNVKEAVSIVEKWVKAHGGKASDRQLADLAYMALRYSVIRQKEKTDDMKFAMQYYAVLEKLRVGLPFGVGVTASRRDVPVDMMIRFTEPDYMVMVGDTCYFSKLQPTLLPGEMLPDFDGEKYMMFKGRPGEENLQLKQESGALPLPKAVANTLKVESEISVDFEGDDDDRLAVTTTLTAIGAFKEQYAAIVPTVEAIASLERYLGVGQADLNGHVPEGDADKRKEAAEKIARNLWGGKDIDLSSWKVLSYGVTPDSSDIKLKFAGVVQDAVKQAGVDLVVNLGLFISEQTQIKGSKRRRDVSILRSSPERYDITIKFRIPEGYELMEESLEEFRRSLAFKDATFNSSATVEGDVVTVRVIERYGRSVYPASSWDAILTISDATFEFNSASILLKRR